MARSRRSRAVVESDSDEPVSAAEPDSDYEPPEPVAPSHRSRARLSVEADESGADQGTFIVNTSGPFFVLPLRYTARCVVIRLPLTPF